MRVSRGAGHDYQPLIGREVLRLTALAVIARFILDVDTYKYTLVLSVLLQAMRESGWSRKEVAQFFTALAVAGEGSVLLAVQKVETDFDWISISQNFDEVFGVQIASVLRACLGTSIH